MGLWEPFPFKLPHDPFSLMSSLCYYWIKTTYWIMVGLLLRIQLKAITPSSQILNYQQVVSSEGHVGPLETFPSPCLNVDRPITV